MQPVQGRVNRFIYQFAKHIEETTTLEKWKVSFVYVFSLVYEV